MTNIRAFGFVFFAVFVLPLSLFAQKPPKPKKPEMLVYGSGALAFAAALQGAKSGVPTLWVTENEELIPELTGGGRLRIDNLPHLDGGIWLDLLMETGRSKAKNDSLAQAIKQDINPQLVKNALERMLAAHPLLTVLRSQPIHAINRQKKDWQVTLGNKQRFLVRAVLDAGKEQRLRALAGIENPAATSAGILPIGEISLEHSRTLVASGQSGDEVYGVSLTDLLAAERDNFFDLAGLQGFCGDERRNIPFKTAIGQALGATAAYVAFFKTTADKIDVRKLQTELLAYGAKIVPYRDIQTGDSHFNTVQRFGLSGMLQGRVEDGVFLLGKAERVAYKEIEPIFNRLYTRSQLWFADNQGEYFTWKDFLSLVKFVGMRGEIEKQVERDWSTKLKFDGAFDLDAHVNRYQFAVILERYAPPYPTAVTREGGFVR